MSEIDQPLSQLVQTVQQSRKYRHLYDDLIVSVARQELEKRQSLKEATKATKNKLHQIAGAYFNRRPNYETWLASLRLTQKADGTTDQAKLAQTCFDLLVHHASTQERMTIVDQFYTTTLADLPPISTVLDLACGLNPLTWPWLPLAPSAHYYACDIYLDLMAFLEQTWPLMSLEGHAFCCNLLSSVPAELVDLALVLKILPVLEQVERGRSLTVLRSIQARYILVSFPAQSLGGRKKGMITGYDTWFNQTIKWENWRVQRFEFETELAFLIEKPG